VLTGPIRSDLGSPKGKEDLTAERAKLAERQSRNQIVFDFVSEGPIVEDENEDEDENVCIERRTSKVAGRGGGAGGEGGVSAVTS